MTAAFRPETVAAVTCHPLYPPCCSSPCPVEDSDLKSEAEDWGKKLQKLNENYRQFSAELDDTTARLKGASASVASLPIAPRLSLPERELDKAALPKYATGAVPENGGEARINEVRKTLESLSSTPDAPSVSQMREKALERSENANATTLNAWAIALSARAGLGERIEREKAVADEIAKARTLDDEIRANSNARHAVEASIEEANALLATLLELRASRAIAGSGTVITFDMPANPTYETPPAETQRQAQARNLTLDLAEHSRLVAEAAEAHNESTAQKMIAAEIEAMRPTIAQHEARKEHVVAMESDLYAALAQLYEDPAYALEKLRNEARRRDPTVYPDGNRYQAAAMVARQLAAELSAQAPQTAYGRRRPSECGAYIVRYGNPAPPVLGAAAAGNESCPRPWATYDWAGPTSGTQRIDAYYAGSYEAYKPIPAALDPEGRQDGLEYLIQYYLEAQKRKEWWDPLRRGDGRHDGIMTGAFWQEITSAAPECLTGPLPTTPANLAARPEMFDLSPDCAHHRWSTGPLAGELIEHSELGGADAAVWALRNSQLEHQLRQPQLADEAASLAAADEIARRDPGAAARALGMTGAAARYEAERALVGQMRDDPDHLRFVNLDN